MAHHPRPVVAALVWAALVAGCSVGTPADTETDSEHADRVRAVVNARDLVVGPAQELGTAAAGLSAALHDLAGRPEPVLVTAVRSAAIRLADAIDAVSSLTIEPSTPDTVAAVGALTEAGSEATVLRESALVVADAVDALTPTSERLAGIVARWDEPGSRSQLLDRFAVAAAAAADIAASDDGPPGCPGPQQEQADAAAFVADATRELEDLIEARDGNGFDARRAELADAPYGTAGGVPRALDDAVDPDACPALAEATDAARGVVDALGELQAALNPTDLAS